MLAVLSIVLLLFLYAPLLVAAMYAFNGESRLTWPPAGFSLRWFGRIFQDDLFRSAFITSLQAAVVTAIVGSVIGAAAALVFSRRTQATLEAPEVGEQLARSLVAVIEILG